MSDNTTTKPSIDEKLPDGVFYRGRRLWISYYAPRDGRMKQIREPATRPDGTAARTVKEAARSRAARLEEVAMHRRGVRQFQGPRAERLLFTELLDAYERHADIHALKSLPQIRSRGKRLRAWFAGYRALAVTQDVLLRFVQARQADGAAPATINRETEIIGRAFALAVSANLLSVAPKVPSLREDNARQGFFERADFEAVAKHMADDDVRDFLVWFFWTGMRPGEIRSLTWAAFDRETWTLRLHASGAKTGHGRVLALVDELRAVMERRLRVRRLDCPLIFHRAGRPMGEFRKTWASACRAAGLAVTDKRAGKTITRPLRLPYDLRRTAVRNMVRAGVAEHVAMSISGHRTRNVFDRYNIVDDRDLRDAVTRTTAYVSTLPTTSTVTPLRAVDGASK
jgi:integrase